MNAKTRALIVEDETPQRQLIATILSREGLEVSQAGSGEEALKLIQDDGPDLILCDWRMPGMDGGQLLDELQSRGHPASFIVMTAYGSISHAVEALKRGAADYLAKPFERDALLLSVRRVLNTRRLEVENKRLRETVSKGEGMGDLIGKAEPMERLYRTLMKVASTDVTVLIQGESGTGKELVARTLHRESPRREGPFVALNCAAIPESLIESELFGHERGAFTGAHKQRPGKIEEARGGTLFLDEIPSMPLPLQGALLRVLQEKRFTPLGGQGEIESDVRVIAASNRDLITMVKEGSFREDLYYRLAVVPLQVPALRHRGVDIPLLAQVFLERSAARYGVELAPLSPEIIRPLLDYPWPGNVRELENLMERLTLLAEGGQVQIGDLPEAIRHPRRAGQGPFRLPPEGIQWDTMEADLIKQALSLAAGNRSAAARLLGLTYKAFLYRLEKFGLG